MSKFLCYLLGHRWINGYIGLVQYASPDTAAMCTRCKATDWGWRS